MWWGDPHKKHPLEGPWSIVAVRNVNLIFNIFFLKIQVQHLMRLKLSIIENILPSQFVGQSGVGLIFIQLEV